MKPLTHDCWDQSLLDLSGHYSEVADLRDFYCKVSSLKGVHCVSAGVRDLYRGENGIGLLHFMEEFGHI